jgi:hypothetical protein
MANRIIILMKIQIKINNSINNNNLLFSIFYAIYFQLKNLPQAEGVDMRQSRNIF